MERTEMRMIRGVGVCMSARLCVYVCVCVCVCVFPERKTDQHRDEKEE